MFNKLFLKAISTFFMLMLSAKVLAFSCSVDGGPNIGTGTTNVHVNLDPVIAPNQNLVVDLSQHISCWNSYGGWQDTDHINLVKGSSFGGSLTDFKGSLYWNGSTYPFPLMTDTNVLDIGEKTPMPLPLKLFLTPISAAGGVIIKPGDIIAYIHMYKISEWNGGDPRNFSWVIIANNTVTIPTGGCDVDNRDLTVNLPDYPGTAEIPLRVHCASNQRLSFYLTGPTTDSSQQLFKNLISPESSGAQGIGIQVLRKGEAIRAQKLVPLGVVNTAYTSLGLSATYGRTPEPLSAGRVQSIISVTFVYE